MASSQDTEITLGTGKLLVLFFGLVALCALFFAMGYSLGRKSEPAVSTASAAIPSPGPSGKMEGGTPAATPAASNSKSVEKGASQEQPAPPEKKDATTPSPLPASNGVDPSTTTPSASYFVQVAAVSKQEDADSLVDALKKKDYTAFVASTSGNDKLFRVQVGPFSDIKDAETTRIKLISDGYSPILKK